MRVQISEGAANEEDWGAAAAALGGVDADAAGLRWLPARRLEHAVRVAMLYLEADDPGVADAYVKRAAGLVVEVKVGCGRKQERGRRERKEADQCGATVRARDARDSTSNNKNKNSHFFYSLRLPLGPGPRAPVPHLRRPRPGRPPRLWPGGRGVPGGRPPGDGGQRKRGVRRLCL